MQSELKSKIKREAKKLAFWWAITALAMFPLFPVMAQPTDLGDVFQILLATMAMAPLAWLISKIGW